MKKRREALGGFYPKRRQDSQPVQVPDLASLDAHLKGSGDREISTTMAFVRVLASLTKDKRIGKRVVPIVPDEARTFGMEGMFRQLGIYTDEGQKYVPNDRDQIMYYREDKAVGFWRRVLMRREPCLRGLPVPLPTVPTTTP